MTRVSVKEAYSNRDLIAQIVRLKTYVEQGTFKEVSTSYSGGVLVLTFTAYDDSTQSFSIPMDSIVGITGDQVGNVVTLHVEFASGTVVDIPYTIANADTSPTPDTLGLRDASGKLFAADPASGATDTSLVTANWVSQTGNSAPNNLVHRTGDEEINGIKTFNNVLVDRTAYIKNTTGSTQPIPVFKLSAAMRNDGYGLFDVFIGTRNDLPSIVRIIWNGTSISTNTITGTLVNTPSIWKDTNNDYYLCFNMVSNNTATVFLLTCLRTAGFYSKPIPMNTSSTPSLTGWTQVTT